MFFFSSRRRHTRSLCDWSSDVYSSDLFLRGRQVVRSMTSTILVWAHSHRAGQLMKARILLADDHPRFPEMEDRKSTRLNSSHTVISYAVFCLKKKHNASISR